MTESMGAREERAGAASMDTHPAGNHASRLFFTRFQRGRLATGNAYRAAFFFTRPSLCDECRRAQHVSVANFSTESGHGVVGRLSAGRPGCRDICAVPPGRPFEEFAMTVVEIVSLALVVAVGVYLFVALLKPEKFQ